MTKVIAAANEGGSGIESIINPACLLASKNQSEPDDTDKKSDNKSEQQNSDQEAYQAYLECLNTLK